MLEKNTGKAKLVFKNYPLRNHKFAMQAAVAALAANQQGKFWPFHNQLFKNFRSLNDEKVKEIAGTVGLDMTKFDQDIRSGEFQRLVMRDMKEGQAVDVKGIPTIFINGRLLTQRSPEGFQAMIDEEYARATRK